MSAVNTDVLQGLGLTRPPQAETKSRENLGQSQFLKLMTVQLAHQDPFKPMENGDFLGQMAQFSTVTGLEQLTSSFEKLSQSVNQGQAMQAATLVGRNVQISATQAQLDAGQGMNGMVGLNEAAASVTVGVYDANGQLIRNLDLGPRGSGMSEFAWDGLRTDGTPAPAGVYRFGTVASGSGGSLAAETFLGGQIQTVTADNAKGGLILNVKGLGAVNFADVARVG